MDLYSPPATPRPYTYEQPEYGYGDDAVMAKVRAESIATARAAAKARDRAHTNRIAAPVLRELRESKDAFRRAYNAILTAPQATRELREAYDETAVAYLGLLEEVHHRFPGLKVDGKTIDAEYDAHNSIMCSDIPEITHLPEERRDAFEAHRARVMTLIEECSGVDIPDNKIEEYERERTALIHHAERLHRTYPNFTVTFPKGDRPPIIKQASLYIEGLRTLKSFPREAERAAITEPYFDLCRGYDSWRKKPSLYNGVYKVEKKKLIAHFRDVSSRFIHFEFRHGDQVISIKRVSKKLRNLPLRPRIAPRGPAPARPSKPGYRFGGSNQTARGPLERNRGGDPLETKGGGEPPRQEAARRPRRRRRRPPIQQQQPLTRQIPPPVDAAPPVEIPREHVTESFSLRKALEQPEDTPRIHGYAVLGGIEGLFRAIFIPLVCVFYLLGLLITLGKNLKDMEKYVLSIKHCFTVIPFSIPFDHL